MNLSFDTKNKIKSLEIEKEEIFSVLEQYPAIAIRIALVEDCLGDVLAHFKRVVKEKKMMEECLSEIEENTRYKPTAKRVRELLEKIKSDKKGGGEDCTSE